MFVSDDSDVDRQPCSATRNGWSILLTILLLLSPKLTSADEKSTSAPTFSAADFTEKVAPILKARCAECHGADAQEGKLRLDQLSGISAGGKSGPVVRPGAPAESALVAAIGYADESLQMPPDEKLSEAEIETLTNWIAAGAPHPDGPVIVVDPLPFDPAEARTFWSFRTPERPDVPAVGLPEYVRNPIDAFVLAQLEAKRITPNEVAEKRTLIRRATYDLIGLPPTPDEIDAFLADDSADAFSKVIDRLLASPHYGERWGRHWLDVVRYADSNGLDENIAHGHAWKYRDYVIASLNRDKPWDQFLKEQLAGDLLITDQTEEPTRIEYLTATGFLALGPKVLAEADQTKMLMDIIDEQIDTTGRAFLGLTFGCARCHNHKFDPVSQADYYAMVGIFKSTYTMESLKTIAKWHENPIATTADQTAHSQHLAQIESKKKEIADLVAATTATLAGGADAATAEKQFPEDVRNKLTELRAEQKKLEESTPALPTAMGVKDSAPEDARINIRGSHLTLGRTVDRGIPVVLELGQPLQIAETESGRRQLAEWLTNPSNPLTARVMVNRIWRWHFGQALVPSPDNFGHLGERPVNQPLLDWLATEFVRSGWSLKTMHRTIMLSRTWQLNSDDSEKSLAADPANQLNWKYNLQRLEAESIRDSVLAVSGLLDRSMGGSMLHVGNREFLFNHTSKDETRYDSLRRSVYLPVIRNHLYDGFSLFDCTDGAVPNGDRSTSTVPSQALYLMNSELLLLTATAFAKELISATAHDVSGRIQVLFRRALGREATSDEVSAVTKAADDLRLQLEADGTAANEVETAAWTAICQGIFASNEFLYVD